MYYKMDDSVARPKFLAKKRYFPQKETHQPWIH